MSKQSPKNEREQKESAREDEKKGFPPGVEDADRKEDEIRKEKRNE
jgi:hypothetical protein